MVEITQQAPSHESIPTESSVRQAFDDLLTQRKAWANNETDAGIPHTDNETAAFMLTTEDLPEDLLLTYAEQLKYEADAMGEYDNHRPPYYYQKLYQIKTMDVKNLRRLYEAQPDNNALLDMLTWQVSEKDQEDWMVGSALNVTKAVYDVETIPELLDVHPTDPVFTALTHALQSGTLSMSGFLIADIGYDGMNGFNVKQRTREMRVWMRDALRMATNISDPEEADALTYSASRNTGGTDILDSLVERVRKLGVEKIDVIRKFANISTLSSYSDEQLELMHGLAQGDQELISRLQNLDVNVVLINLDGDHNGVSSEVASRLDDEAQRTLFFEINTPHQVYQHLKKLHDMGIAPSTLIFAAHGSKGQYIIGERPPLDSDETTDHITTFFDKKMVDTIINEAKAEGENVEGYDLDNANGLIRSIQRFMQSSRGINDADKDIGRKKIISLSCEFATTGIPHHIGPNGEKVRGERTSMLKRLGEVIVSKLPDEHIDIFGADISTNQQTRTERGLHYNQVRGQRWEMYPASVLHINGRTITRGRVREIQLRK